MTTTARPAATARTVLSKVPEATAAFWVIKILTTGMGEVVADDLANRIGLYVTAGIAFVLMAAALTWQFRQDRFRAWPYWIGVASVSVFGTSLGDAPRRGLGLSFVETSIILSVFLVVLMAVWFRLEGTLSIHSITNRRREAFYWTTVLTTFALGTAVGDMFTHFGFGFLTSAAYFAAGMAVAYGAHRYLRLNGIFAFWFAYVLTRPLGASLADWSWVPQPFGAGLGKTPVGIVSALAFLALLAVIAKTRDGEPKAVTA